MTILNAVLKEDHAIVVADTLIRDVLGPISGVDRGFVGISKLLPLSHSRAVLATRGTMGWITQAYTWAVLAGGDFDFLADNLLEALVSIYRASSQARHVRAAAADATFAVDSFQILLIGYSPKRQAIAGFVYRRHPQGRAEFERAAIDGWSAPWTEERFGGRPRPSTLEEMIARAREQVAMIKEAAPEHAAGGDLVVCRISKETMTFTSVGLS